MDTSQWSQERVRRGEKEEALSCPRCNSKDTKFCYYNNYSLTQPRYLCKACRRYWTHGGSLRTIPIGGASRKIKRSSSSSSSSKKALLLNKRPPKSITHINEVKAQDFGVSQDEDVKDFSQGFGTPRVSEFLQLPSINDSSLVSSSSSAMELQGISNSSTSSNPPSTFMAFPNFHHHSLYPAASSGTGTGFGLSYDFLRPPLGFSLDGVDPYDALNLQEGSKGSHATTIRQERHLFPVESLKFPASSTSTNSGGRAHEEEEDAEQTAGFWTGMLADGNGSWQ